MIVGKVINKIAGTRNNAAGHTSAAIKQERASNRTNGIRSKSGFSNEHVQTNKHEYSAPTENANCAPVRYIKLNSSKKLFLY
ncbi:hypothetical protein CL653_03225 [bacterium]|nr:hypothetical protein [bacterium]